jgi:hypothetical protein
VQAEIQKMEETREKNERQWMQDLETAYNQELLDAGAKIVVIYNLMKKLENSKRRLISFRR